MDELAAGLQLQGAASRYVLERPLGEGGFGLTWRARDEAGRAVVVKQLRLERAQDWKSVELFEREAQVMASLDHPNIPKLIDRMNGGDGALYLVQEFVPGQPLSVGAHV
jgi:eukaryotic-like serine/threonine-protein kinase